jgi:hypothetical protein
VNAAFLFMFLDGGKNVFFAEKGQEVIAQGTRACAIKTRQ